MATLNFKQIHAKIDQFEQTQKKVKSEVEWLKSKQRKDRNCTKKVKESRYEPQEAATVEELSMGLETVNYQLKGLD